MWTSEDSAPELEHSDSVNDVLSLLQNIWLKNTINNSNSNSKDPLVILHGPPTSHWPQLESYNHITSSWLQWSVTHIQRTPQRAEYKSISFSHRGKQIIKHSLYATTGQRRSCITAFSLCCGNVIALVVAGCDTLALQCVGAGGDEADQLPW